MGSFSIKIRRLIFFTLILILLAMAGTVPIKHTTKAPCIIQPVEIWYLMRDGAGQIATGWELNRLGSPGDRKLWQFESSDIVELHLESSLRDGSVVNSGDAIAYFTSDERTGKLLGLKSLLDKAVAVKDELLAGERIADIEVADREVQVAETALNTHLTTYNRVKELTAKGHATVEQWETVQNEHSLLDAELQLAKSKQEALLSGAKQEAISVAEAEISYLEQMITNTEKSLSLLEVINAPFTGIVRLGDIEGRVLRLERTDSVAVVISIPQTIAGLSMPGRDVQISVFAAPERTISGTIRNVDFISGLSVAAANAYLPNEDDRLKFGMNGLARLTLGKMTLWQGIRLKLQDLGI